MRPANNVDQGVSFSFGSETVRVTLPESGSGLPSVFAVGLMKGGSSLLSQVTRALAQTTGLAYFSLTERMFEAGVRPRDIPEAANTLFRERGYLYGGFRSFPPATEMPAWASARTVLLVRDPRDMLVSFYFSHAYSHRQPGAGAGGLLRQQLDRSREEAKSMSPDEFALRRHGEITGQFRAAWRKLSAVEHRVYRYEDVIFAKRGWLQDMASYYALAVPPVTLDAIADRADIIPESERAGQHIRRVTPGDHRDKLKPETVARLDEAFADILVRHGYD